MQFYCFYVYIYRMNVICFMMIIFFYLNEIKIIIESVNTPYVYVLGDFNADIQSDSVFGSELVEFCTLNKLDFIDRITLPSSSFTFISQAHGTTSWLDHIVLLQPLDGHLFLMHLLLIMLYVLIFSFIQARQTRPNSGGVADGHPRFDKGGVAIIFYFIRVKNRTF